MAFFPRLASISRDSFRDSDRRIDNGCDPSYDWSPINQLKRALKDELGKSRLSVRVVADALRTSPAQVVRLLEENRASKQLLQLFKLAELAGYKVEFRLKKKSAA